MRFLKLILTRFGMFTDMILDFESSDGSFHLILGPNEAGKSTIRRALENFLFGIPERTTDGFRHPPRNLLIEGILEDSNGKKIHLKRRKGRKNTLLNALDQPVDESVLADLLGNLERHTFSAMFCLDHVMLRKGGKELAAGHGKLGAGLFGAAAGLTGLIQLKDKLNKEAETLFRPRATTLPINRHIKDYIDKKRDIKEACLRPAEWKSLHTEQNDLKKQSKTLSINIQSLKDELTYLNDLKNAIPTAQKIDEISKQIRELNLPIVIPESDIEAFNHIRQELENIRSRQDSIQEKRQQLTARLTSLELPESILAERFTIEELERRWDRICDFRTEQHQLRGERITELETISETADKLGLKCKPDDIDFSFVTLTTESEIKNLLQTYIDLEKKQNHLLDDLALRTSEKENLLSQRNAMSPPRDVSHLQHLIKDIRLKGDLEKRLEDLDDEINTLKTSLGTQVPALHPPVKQDDDGIPVSLPLPEEQTIQRFNRLFQDLSSRKQRLHEYFDEWDEKRRRLEKEISDMDADHRLALLSETSLLEIRRKRDEDWRLIDDAWRGTSSLPDGLSEDVLAKRFEEEIRQADTVSDGLRKQADQVAVYNQRCSELEDVRHHLEELSHKEEELEKEQQQVEEEWKNVWRPCHLEALLPPSEMLSWLNRYRSILKDGETLKGLLNKKSSLFKQITTYKRVCIDRLTELDVAGLSSDLSLSVLLNKAEEFIEKNNDLSGRLNQLEKNIDWYQQEIKRLTRQLESIRNHLKQLIETWREKIKPWTQYMKDTFTPESAEEILETWRTLKQSVRKVQKIDKTIAHHQSEINIFENTVKHTAQKCGLTPDPDDTLEEQLFILKKHLKTALEIEQKRNEISQRLSDIEEEFAQLSENKMQLSSKLKQILNRAGCSGPDEFHRMAQRSGTYRDLKEKLTLLTQELEAKSISMEQIRRGKTEYASEDLIVLIEEKKERLEEFEQAYRDCRDKIISNKTKMSLMDGGSKAAEYAAEAEEILADLDADVREYIRLKLAAHVLADEQKRFLDRYQNPLLENASGYFKFLTNENFAALKMGFDDNGVPILLCIRSSGEPVQIDGLSDGTKDQLYLALRLSAIDGYTDRSSSPPLILDDVLIHFDDARARSALKVLSDFSNKLQILFFTHHDALLTLAKQTIPKNRLVVHSLTGFIPAFPSNRSDQT